MARQLKRVLLKYAVYIPVRFYGFGVLIGGNNFRSRAQGSPIKQSVDDDYLGYLPKHEEMA